MAASRLPTLAAVAASRRLPSVLVDLEAFDANVAEAERLVAAGGLGLKVRLATKSVRVPALIRRVLDRGPPWQGLMCFSAEEAAFLAAEGVGDLLVAYPTAQPSDLELLRELHEGGHDIKLMVDARAGVERVAAAMEGVERPFPLVVDLDASLRLVGQHLGVRRSPVRGPEAAVALFEAAQGSVRAVGVMAYEAQVAGLPDKNPFKKAFNVAAGWVRRTSVKAVADRRRRVREGLEAAGFEVELFNGGGTGLLDSSSSDRALTEVTMGSGLLCPHLFDYYSNVRFRPACFFALQVVRSSDPGFVTCAGGGYIASGEPGWDRVPVPAWPEGLKLVATEGCGEVQTPLEVSAGEVPALGSPVLFRHAKAGELMERFEEALLVDGRGEVAAVKTYRGWGACFF